MKKNKICIIISIVLFVIAIIVIPNIKSIRKKHLENYVNSIIYDIKISRNDMTIGGYASNEKFELIRIKDGEAYIIENYFVFGIEDDPVRKGNNYGKIEKKHLSKDKIDELINFINNYKDEDSIYYKDKYNDGYSWTIEYNDKKIELENYDFIY